MTEHRIYTKIEGTQVTIYAPCTQCRKVSELHVSDDEWYDYIQRGVLIQNSLTSLTPAERELLISGYCAKCFAEIFTDEEEDD